MNRSQRYLGRFNQILKDRLCSVDRYLARWLFLDGHFDAKDFGSGLVDRVLRHIVRMSLARRCTKPKRQSMYQIFDAMNAALLVDRLHVGRLHVVELRFHFIIVIFERRLDVALRYTEIQGGGRRIYRFFLLLMIGIAIGRLIFALARRGRRQNLAYGRLAIATLNAIVAIRIISLLNVHNLWIRIIKIEIKSLHPRMRVGERSTLPPKPQRCFERRPFAHDRQEEKMLKNFLS